MVRHNVADSIACSDLRTSAPFASDGVMTLRTLNEDLYRTMNSCKAYVNSPPRPHETISQTDMVVSAWVHLPPYRGSLPAHVLSETDIPG